MSHDVPVAVLEAYGFAQAKLTPITVGLINRTFRVDAAAPYVLQRLNPIFGPEVHEDIEAVTRHLERAGLVTPRLVPERYGGLFVRDAEGGVWRALTFVEGHTFTKAASPATCAAAGELLGRFHRALVDLQHGFRNRRANVHDTARHLQHLRDVLASHAGHARFAEVEPVARRILAAAGALPSLARLPARNVHGDPKLSNVLFASPEAATCLVDLDTLGRMSIPVELGDALRSWCNPAAEDDTRSRLELAYFGAALEGYARGAAGLLGRDELEAIVPAVQTIALELAARFCADALEESYFGWDRTRFTRASEHNLQRARSQLALAASVAEQREPARAAVERAFASARDGK